MSTADRPPEETHSYELSCPLLGIAKDQETRFGFPSPGNRCHRFSPPATITLAYQEETCLSGRYENCIVFQTISPVNLPEGVQPVPKGLILPPGLGLGVIMTSVLVGLILFSWLVTRWIGTSQAEALALASVQTQEAEYFAATETSQSLTVLAPSSTPIPTLTLTPAPSVTPTPIPTATQTLPPPTPGPDIGTPFGPNAMYNLHRVRAGESLQVIASTYNTRSDVITVVNSLAQGISIQPDQVLIILPGVINDIGLIAFQPVFIISETTVSDLAAVYNVSSIDLRRYNSLGEAERILPQRWIIVPVPSEANP